MTPEQQKERAEAIVAVWRNRVETYPIDEILSLIGIAGWRERESLMLLRESEVKYGGARSEILKAIDKEQNDEHRESRAIHCPNEREAHL